MLKSFVTKSKFCLKYNNNSFSSKNLLLNSSFSLSNPQINFNYNNNNNGFNYDNKTKYFTTGAIIGGIGATLYESLKYKNILAEEEIYKIVLTGGPCGGKSTALAHLIKRLTSLGYNVYGVPETATLIITGGVNLGNVTREEFINIETNIIRTQMALEDAFVDIAKNSDKPSVVICDRGILDNRAYVSNDDFQLILDSENLKLNSIRDGRYDAVFHMVTAAIGAEEFYTTANNTARSETVEEARKLDYKVLDAWLGHRHHKVVDNSTGFKDKIKKVVEGICSVIGVPHPRREQRHLVTSVEDWPEDLKFESFDVEIMFLKTKDETQARLYRRGINNSSIYYYSEQNIQENGEVAIVEKSLSGREYLALSKQKDPETNTVRKKVKVFIYNNIYYALNTFENGTIILEVEPDEGIPLDIPSFINVERDVTEEESYTSYHYSKHQ